MDLEWIIANKLIIAVLTAVVPLAVAYVVVKLREIDRYTSNDDWRHLREFVGQVVQAAEQLGAIDDLKEYGNSKLEYAISVTSKWLEQRGLFLDVENIADVVRALIEAEVLRMKDEPLHIEMGGNAGIGE